MLLQSTFVDISRKMSRSKNFPISSSDIDFKNQEKAQHDTYIILLNH